MRILVAHAYYQQAGGEDLVFEGEAALLEDHGHDVVRFTLRNDIADEMSGLALAKAAFWNKTTYGELFTLLEETRPDVAHFHNTFPLLSPSVYDACRRRGVPVVQTLHNYRLGCPNANLFRDGGPCEDCIGKLVKWPGVVHACYRNDRAATAVVAGMLAFHRLRRTYLERVDAFIALTEAGRDVFVRMGLPADRIVVKPNSVPDPGVVSWPADGGRGRAALYVGRLSPEKGVATLLAAWRDHRAPVPLRIVGDGPMAGAVADAARSTPQITLVGPLDREGVRDEMARASALVFPSECYETMGNVVPEAFSAGLPVLASDVSAGGSLVTPWGDGMRFRSGDPKDLVAQLGALLALPDLPELRQRARATYEARFTPDVNYRALHSLYEGLVSSASSAPL